MNAYMSVYCNVDIFAPFSCPIQFLSSTINGYTAHLVMVFLQGMRLFRLYKLEVQVTTPYYYQLSA